MSWHCPEYMTLSHWSWKPRIHAVQYHKKLTIPVLVTCTLTLYSIVHSYQSYYFPYLCTAVSMYTTARSQFSSKRHICMFLFFVNKSHIWAMSLKARYRGKKFGLETCRIVDAYCCTWTSRENSHNSQRDVWKYVSLPGAEEGISDNIIWGKIGKGGTWQRGKIRENWR